MRFILRCTLVLSLFATALSAQVVINEISTGPADWVEIANLGASPVDVSGWHLLVFEDTGLALGAPFTLPGAAGSGLVVLPAGACLVVTDDPFLMAPETPVGTLKFFFGFNVPWNTGEAGSLLLTDAPGNGVDYFAHGNPNLLLAPFTAGAWFGSSGSTTSTTWSLPASPVHGLNDRDVHARNGTVDTDVAADFSMRALPAATPGELNPFQSPIDADGLPPVAAFEASALQGVSPLTVHFTNTSSGDCELSSSFWDLDAGGSGGAVAFGFDASHTFVVPAGTPPGASVAFDVVLHLDDVCGAAVASAPTTITVFAPEPLVPQVVGFREDFEGAIGPDGTTLGPGDGWDVRGPDPTSRVRTIDPRTVGAPPGYGDATLSSGPRVAVLDSALNANAATNELVLHIDGDAIAAGGASAFRVVLWLYDNHDEIHPQDVIAFQDGVTPGPGVDRLGQALPTPGLDGFLEVWVADWHQTVEGAQDWTRVELHFDAAFFAAHPQLATPGSGSASDYRLVIRQRDDFRFEGDDGLLIDDVRILGPVTPGGGQAADPLAALVDLNDAVNANANPVDTAGDPEGPFFTHATPGSPMVFTFQGEANKPVLLLAGPLNVGAWSHPTIGQLDIGGPPDPTFGLPSGLVILADGTVTDFINSIFNTTPLGTQVLSFTTPNLPPGFTTTLQAVVYNTLTVVRISNAIQLTIN